MTYFSDRYIRSKGPIVAASYILTNNASYVTVSPQTAAEYMIQSGNATVTGGNSSIAVEFPIAFSAAPMVVANIVTNATPGMTASRVVSTTTTQFMFSGNLPTTHVPFQWIAHGLK